MQKGITRYTQELDGFQVVDWKVLVDRAIVINDMTALQCLAVRRNAKATIDIWIERTAPYRCPECGCKSVSIYKGRERIIRGLPNCNIPTVIRVTSHRTCCPDCGKRHQETFPFLSRAKSRVTKQLERTIVALRGEMSTGAISDYCDLDWKHREERREAKARGRLRARSVWQGLGRRHRRNPGVPERQGGLRYVTAVRDLETGDVLFAADGKGSDVLAEFGRHIRRWRRRIKYVCMDMSNAYAKWVREHLPEAAVVYDHFHVVKAMNGKLDAVRRRTTSEMESGIKRSIKGCHRILTANAKVPELGAMARMITEHMEGVPGYWKYDGASNASTEGFNSKIRWLTTQAYGLRDRDYFKLKVFSLPTLKTSKSL